MLGILGYAWRSTQFALLGLRQFTRDGYAASAKSFDESVMQRDLKGHCCFVTGANQGIGYQTSLELANRNATLYMVCRNQERGESAAQRVRAVTGNQDVHLKLCDVSSLDSVRELAASVEAEQLPCHLLVNNAGVLVHTPDSKSSDGFEINFATNTLGTFALTSLMLPALKRAVVSTAGTARVVFVSSGGMYTEGLEVEDLQMEKGKFKGEAQYAKDKRRQVVMAERFAELNRDTGIVFTSMHPGWTETEGVKNALPGFSKQMEGKLRSLSQGADTIAWLALTDDRSIEPGGFYFDRKPQTKHLFWAGTSHPPAMVDKLWARLSELAHLEQSKATAT